jgi:hypothetical protein
MSSKSRIVFLTATLTLLPTPAFAYIDPAVGSMFVQAVIGAIAVAGTAWYTLRQKLSEFWKNAKSAVSTDAAKSK